jgi:small subunit ribosomal protein S4
MVRKPYPPGQHGKNSKKRPTEYGTQLAEKQKIKMIYGVREKQFKRYFDLATKRSGVTPEIIVELLERRLDNVVFRLGIAPTRNAARQLVSHGHMLVNGKKANSPSFSVKAGDIIDIKESSKSKKIFANTRTILKKFQTPKWLEIDKDKLSSKVIGLPDKEITSNIPVQVSKVLEFYSR